MELGSLADWIGLIFAILSGALSVYLAREQLRELPFGRIKKTAIRFFMGLFITLLVWGVFQLGKSSSEPTLVEVTRIISQLETTPVVIAKEVTREVTRIVPQEVEIGNEKIVEVTVPVEVTSTTSASCQVPELKGRSPVEAANLISSFGLQPVSSKEYTNSCYALS